jgi:ribonuclease HI
MPDLPQVTVTCDGSCLGNGTPSARAGAVAILQYKGVHGEHTKIVGEIPARPTNQAAEIAAACVGLEAINRACNVTIYSDSNYVVETMRGNFKRKANHDLWTRLDNAAQQHEVKWEWIPRNSTAVHKKCDKAASIVAEMASVDQNLLDQILRA